MTGLLVAISIVLFAVGFLAGALLVIAVGIRAEDKATMQRRDGSILLHEEPVGHLTRGVRAERGGTAPPQATTLVTCDAKPAERCGSRRRAPSAAGADCGGPSWPM